MNRSGSGYLYIVLCALIFSTMEVMLKTVSGVFAPMQITAVRFFTGGVIPCAQQHGKPVIRQLTHGLQADAPVAARDQRDAIFRGHVN
jgi:drug/metabolite transporter (DMT)-like permease